MNLWGAWGQLSPEAPRNHKKDTGVTCRTSQCGWRRNGRGVVLSESKVARSEV